jgi:hypothetical protein
MTLITLNPILRVEDLFDSLDKEQREPDDRKIEIKKSERLEEIIRGFEKALKIEVKNSEQGYNDLKKMIKFTPTSKEITDFSILMSDYSDEFISDRDKDTFETNSGLYLSALINKSNEQEIIINTRHLHLLPDYLGKYNNGKIISVNGDAGRHLGDKMLAGNIYARDARSFLGSFLTGGIIYVKNARKFVGDYMQGGTIHIENICCSLSDQIHGGNIYHQGRLIVKDGVKLI